MALTKTIVITKGQKGSRTTCVLEERIEIKKNAIDRLKVDGKITESKTNRFLFPNSYFINTRSAYKPSALASR